MLQLHLSDEQFSGPFRCGLYQRFDGKYFFSPPYHVYTILYVHDFIVLCLIVDLFSCIFMPLGAGGIMCSGCPSVRLSVRLSVRPKPEIPSFDLYMGPLVHPTNRNRFTACPSVRPSGEVSGHLPENAWKEWPEILHADVSWPSSELISLWLQSVDFCNFGTILT